MSWSGIEPVLHALEGRVFTGLPGNSLTPMLKMRELIGKLMDLPKIEQFIGNPGFWTL